VVTATQGDITSTITQPATIQGGNEAVLYAKTAGYLKTIYVDKGDRVRAGQLLAVIESPELANQSDQARATYRQSQSATLGVVATKSRAQADVAQAAASVERARSEALQGDAVIARAQAEQARVEAQVPKLKAAVQEAEANVQGAQEQQAQAQAEVGRWQQQVKASEAAVRTLQSALQKAQADAQLQRTTYSRLKAVQDKDSGLIAAQQVDEARARMAASQSEVETAQNRVEAARQETATVEQQLEAARRGAAAAASKVDAAKSHVLAARGDLQASQQDIEAARQQVKVAQAQRDSAQRQVGVAEAQRSALAAQVRVTDAQIATARQQGAGSRSAMQAAANLADYARIVAPFDGIVTERLVDPGAFVQNAAGNQAGARGIVKVVSDRTLRIMIPVPEANIPYISKGKTAVLAVDAYPKQTFTGTVTRFASAVDPKSRTMLTEVDLLNAAGKLRPGMFARVTLTLETRRNALSVPSEALMGKEDRSVYVVEGGKAHKVPVIVGVDDGKMAEIKEGLQPGAQVVLTGRDALVDGAPVKAEPAPVEPAKK
jgi:RND family efflux transporter MFP subunit